MKGKNGKRLSVLLIAAILLGAVCPAALPISAGAATAKASKAGGSTLASRLEGKYSCMTKDSEGELYYTLEIADFHGNLYARDTYSYKYDEDSDFCVQSYNAMELIPENPAELSDTRADSVSVGIQSFTNQANAGMYQAPPAPWTVTLTKTGILLTQAPEDSLFPDTGEGSLELFREEGAEDFYESAGGYLSDESAGESSAGGKAQEIPEDIFGIWRQKGAENPLILDFAGQDLSDASSRGRITLWQKIPGKEVLFARGKFQSAPPESAGGGSFGTSKGGSSKIQRMAKASGRIEVLCAMLQSGGEPYFLEDSYTLEDKNTLVFAEDIAGFAKEWDGEESASGEPASAEPASGEDAALSEDDGRVVFERITEKDIPLTVLKDPDDADALLKKVQRVRLSGGESRRIVPQFAAAEDIENNGGMFLRLGNAVFYRRYDPAASEEKIAALWGRFMTNSQIGDGSELWFYDLESGRGGIICDNAGYGPLWYLNGWIYATVREEVEEGGYMQSICRFLPDGSRRETLTNDEYAQIRAVSENNRYLCVTEYGESGTYVMDGTVWQHEITRPGSAAAGERHDYLFAGFAGNNLILTDYDLDRGAYVFYEYLTETYELITLGTVETDEYHSSYMEVQQLCPDGEDLYIGIGWYSGSGQMFTDYAVLKARSGRENSLETVQEGMPKGHDLEDGAPYFFINVDGEMLFNKSNPDGEVVLSETSAGDLIYIDSPYSAWQVVLGLIPESPLITEEDKTTQFLQCAEAAGDTVWFLMADAVYAPEENIGWRQGYRLTGLRCYKVDLKDTPLDAAKDKMERWLIWEK